MGCWGKPGLLTCLGAEASDLRVKKVGFSDGEDEEVNSGWETAVHTAGPESLLLTLGGLGQDVGLPTPGSPSSAAPPLCKPAPERLVVVKTPVVSARGSGSWVITES